MSSIATSVLVCLATLAALISILRHEKLSLGLPVAYLFGLLLIHVPGAAAELVAADRLGDANFVSLGIRFTAIASVCFVLGVWIGTRGGVDASRSFDVDHRRFWRFCLFGGWFLIYGLTPLRNIPSVGAAIHAGGALWMLGVMLALRDAVRQGEMEAIGLWLCALGVFPLLMLLFGGFLSYGSTAAITVLSVLVISTRSWRRVTIGLVIVSFLGLTVFVNWFQHRDEIRDSVWYGDPLTERVAMVADAGRDFAWFDLFDPLQQNALDERLNQNYFEGVAATRLRDGTVDYLHGRSIWNGVLGLVPRILWPSKPVIAGSPEIVAEMTGLVLDPNTSFGIGNVMEFQINFGIPGLIVGFLVLGWALGLVDRRAAAAERRGDLGGLCLLFLLAVALIDPGGSLVEVGEGLAAALVAGYGWRWLWGEWSARFRRMPVHRVHRSAPLHDRRLLALPPREDLPPRY